MASHHSTIETDNKGPRKLLVRRPEVVLEMSSSEINFAKRMRRMLMPMLDQIIKGGIELRVTKQRTDCFIAETPFAYNSIFPVCIDSAFSTCFDDDNNCTSACRCVFWLDQFKMGEKL